MFKSIEDYFTLVGVTLTKTFITIAACKSKLFVEDYIRTIPELNHVNIRTALVYGPGDESNRVLNKFLNMKTIILFKGGDQQILDYIHVSDLCNFIKQCVYGQYTGTYNVCTGNPITVYELANMFTDKTVIIEDVKPDEYSIHNPNLKRTMCEVKGVSLSNKKISETGWKPVKDLKTYISEYLD